MKKIIFIKNDKKILIDSLSTGEKQIVFRGASLLKNVNAINDGIVLIDEPELSLHPRWQLKILDYYRGLFAFDCKQKAQMIFATHSIYMVDSALTDKENVLIIILKEENGIIKKHFIDDFRTLDKSTHAEINYFAFNMATKDYLIELFSYLQLEKNMNVKKTDDFILNSEFYDQKIHFKYKKYRDKEYFTLPTYIRNSISHNAEDFKYNIKDLEEAIKLLINIINSLNAC